MQNKYGQALGLWELNIGRDESQGPLVLRPKKGDNFRLGKILTNERNRTDKSLMLEQIGSFIVELIAREEKPNNDQEREDLEFYVESNITNLMSELLVAFRWTTKEKLEEQEKQLSKNLNPQLS